MFTIVSDVFKHPVIEFVAQIYILIPASYLARQNQGSTFPVRYL